MRQRLMQVLLDQQDADALLFTSSISRNTSGVTIGITPSDGSSEDEVSRGSAMQAAPIASICCSPPLLEPASCPRRSNRRGNRPKA